MEQHPFSPQEIQKFHIIFDMFDVHCNGQMLPLHLVNAINLWQYQGTTREEAHFMVEKVGKKQYESISFENFVAIMAVEKKIRDRQKDIMASLRIYDPGWTGYISTEKYGYVLSAEGLPDAEIRKVIKQTPKENNGKIMYEHLIRKMAFQFYEKKN